MYDMIVIGAGPAGCTAAKRLAASGCRVLLVERFALPRNKSCSGVLIQKSLTLVKSCFGQEVPLEVTCTPAQNKGMIVTAADGRVYRFEQAGLNVWRSRFDAWLARLAQDAGAELIDGTDAVDCTQNDDGVTVTLRTNGGPPYRRQARYVLLCEGVTSVLTRALTDKRPDCIATYQTFCSGRIDLDPHYFYAYLQPELSGYDAWFNVKDHQLVLGVAGPQAAELPTFHRRFSAYLQQTAGLNIDTCRRSETWRMPRIVPTCPVLHGRGRILSAGEGAGWLNPMGEGISCAMESAVWAAEALLAHPTDPTAALDAYRQSTRPLTTYMRRQWNFTANLSPLFAGMRE